MKYRDLIQFEPVETVIQLISSEDADYAAQLVQTYVISERMAEVITEVIIPHLQFHYPMIIKGLGGGELRHWEVAPLVCAHLCCRRQRPASVSYQRSC